MFFYASSYPILPQDTADIGSIGIEYGTFFIPIRLRDMNI